MRYFLLTTIVAFILLTFWVKSAPVLPIDLLISQKVQAINFPGFVHFMTILSNSGWGIKLFTWVAVVAVSLFLLGKRLESVFVLLLSGLDAILFFGLSRLINRPRPTPNLIHVDFTLNVGGFPSGHVLMIALVFGFLIYLSVIYVKKVWIKAVLISVFSGIILLMGLARINSGQHWPTDILGAYILAGTGLIITIYFYGFIRGLKLPSFLARFLRLPENR